ncbi:MAG: hypothetical protein JO227_17855 [Acetobacteraceae bacterium]|nr:hypothetical protein [Acetobacteraceae bacterium]
MNSARLEDRFRWGQNIAARAIGSSTYAYRPQGMSNPLDPQNRFLRLQAAFTGVGGGFARANAYGNALWYGIFDAAYTRPGDYLVQDEGTWFIAAQQKLLPNLCVKANRVLSFSRPAPQASTGVNGYGGITAANVVPLLTGWPASVLTSSGGGQPLAGLPSDSSVPYWNVLLPAFPGATLLPADLMSDDLGRNAVVSAAELTELGWRLIVKQATT